MTTIAHIRKVFTCTDVPSLSKLGAVLFSIPPFILLTLYCVLCSIRQDNPFGNDLLIRSLWFLSLLVVSPVLGYYSYPWSLKGSLFIGFTRSFIIGIVWFFIMQTLLFVVWLSAKYFAVSGFSISDIHLRPTLNWLYFNKSYIPGLIAITWISLSFNLAHHYYSKRA